MAPVSWSSMRLLFLLCLAGCPKAPSAVGDPTLPEAVAEVEAQAPRAELEAAAESLDPAVRARALHLLVRTTDALDTWVPRALYDPSAWVQRAAVDALMERPDGTAALVSYVEREEADPIGRSLAALALPSGDVTLDAWREATAPWDRLPLALAAWHHGDAEAEAAVEAALRTGELPLDLPLMDAIVQHGAESWLPALAEAQERAEPELGTALAAARLQLGDPKGEVELRRALSGDVHQQMEVLDRIATWEGAAPLIRKAQAGGPDLVRTHAELLLTARTGQQPQRLAAALEHADREVRLLGIHAAAQALRHGPADRGLAKAAVEVLKQGVADPDPSVRAAAARALGNHGGPAHGDVLRPLLTDEVQQVRVEAAGALLGNG